MQERPPNAVFFAAVAAKEEKIEMEGEVECELEAEDFAGAVAEAIRTLEVDFVHVLGIERLL